MLRVKGIQNLVIAGTTAEGCILGTIRQASELGFDCLLLIDAVVSSDALLSNYSIETVKAGVGAFGSTSRVRTVSETFNAPSYTKYPQSSLPAANTGTQSTAPTRDTEPVTTLTQKQLQNTAESLAVTDDQQGTFHAGASSESHTLGTDTT